MLPLLPHLSKEGDPWAVSLCLGLDLECIMVILSFRVADGKLL